MKRSAIVTRPIDPAALFNEVQALRFGAVAMFAGTVRDANHGRAVSSIDYSAYISMAEGEMNQILADAELRFGVTALVVEHRIGSLDPGDVSVAIAAAHEHRNPALDATRFVIDEIKTRVPIWKLERYAEGAPAWVEPTRSTALNRP
jgi:molybdopterin synthase catalytic subunit